MSVASAPRAAVSAACMPYWPPVAPRACSMVVSVRIPVCQRRRFQGLRGERKYGYHCNT